MAKRRSALINKANLAAALASLTDVTTALATNRFALLANGSAYVGRAIVEADIADLQSYLTSFTELNDLSGAVVWANIPIANVPTGTTGSTVSLGDHTHAVSTQTATTTQLVDIANAINTRADKVAGFLVFNTTTGLPVWAAGDTDGAVWNNARGQLQHTPS